MELRARTPEPIVAGASLADAQFRLLVESVADYAIFLLDVAGRVVSWNSGAERIKGYAAEEILGCHFSVFYLPEDRAAGKPEAVLQPPSARAAARPRAGGCARTARASGATC